MQNILVVEDDRDLNQAVSYALRKAGYGVCSAAFMEEAKRIFTEN